MPSADGIRSQIEGLTNRLIGLALCDRPNYPSIIQCPDGCREIRAGNPQSVREALRDRPYGEIYKALEEAGAYNLMMLDGALIQMQYRFKDSSIVAHRLAFFPSPDQESFQHAPGAYFDEEVFTGSNESRNVPFPIRFDFKRDPSPSASSHPKAHLTLGHYHGCRIPVRAPLTPGQFIEFLLRNFYDTEQHNFSGKLHPFSARFEETITYEERELAFLHTPL